MNGTEAAILFRQMADRIDRNPSEEFGGAFLVLPPGDAGDPVEGMSVAAKPSPVTFWSSVLGQIELAVETFKTNNEPGARGGRFGR
jgi:hypothetical protein